MLIVKRMVTFPSKNSNDHQDAEWNKIQRKSKGTLRYHKK